MRNSAVAKNARNGSSAGAAQRRQRSSSRSWFALAVVLASLGGIRVAASHVLLTEDEIVRALTLARWPTSDRDRSRFHARYVVTVKSPTVLYYSVETVEVITEFRRLELIAEDHARVNDMFGRGGFQEVRAALTPWHDRVAIVVRLQFAPNGFITGVPILDIRLDGPNTLTPVDGVRSTGVYGQNSMLIGGVVEALFDAREVGQTTRRIIVRSQDPATELARVTVDFGSLE
jgi:hypothetical protein